MLRQGKISDKVKVRQGCATFLLVIGDVLYATLAGGSEGVQRTMFSFLKCFSHGPWSTDSRFGTEGKQN